MFPTLNLLSRLNVLYMKLYGFIFRFWMIQGMYWFFQYRVFFLSENTFWCNKNVLCNICINWKLNTDCILKYLIMKNVKKNASVEI